MTDLDAQTDAQPETEEQAIARLFPPVLAFTGPDDRFLPGIPMRDLNENDIARLVKNRTIGEREDRHIGHAPGDLEYPDARQAVIDQLTGGAFFALAEGKPPKGKTKKPSEDRDPAGADADKE